jgi:FAD/FMN-containing dehydrogenase
MLFDVSLPIAEMDKYQQQVMAQWRTDFPDGHFFIFGHLGDGNLHFCACVGADNPKNRLIVERTLYEPLAKIGGSVSAEHGIGLEKKAWLSSCRSESEIAMMKLLKATFDPTGILNPGKIFD